MRAIFALVTISFTCFCFLVLNLFYFDTAGQNSDDFFLAKRDLLKDTLTDEEILKCQNFTKKVLKDLNQRLTEDELQGIFTQCSLLLRQNSNPFASKNENYATRLSPIKNHKSQVLDFITEEYLTKENLEENAGTIENPPGTSERRGYDVNSTSEAFASKYQNLKEMPTDSIFKKTIETLNFWSYFFENKDSSISSNEIRAFENLGTGSITESSIYFENSITSPYANFEMTSEWNFVMPGTKWCGAGSIAGNLDDLGYFEDVDRCCRNHDICPDIMVPGETKYNLTNTSPFTVLHCKCDDELYNCLSEIDSVASNTVGNTFFNILSRNCYELDYPRTCKKYYTLLGCQEYGINKTAKKVYQWKPAKKYLKMPFSIPG